MEFLTEHDIICFIVLFVVLIVLGTQIQMTIINRKIEDKEGNIIKEIDRLLKDKIKQVLRNN